MRNVDTRNCKNNYLFKLISITPSVAMVAARNFLSILLRSFNKIISKAITKNTVVLLIASATPTLAPFLYAKNVKRLKDEPNKDEEIMGTKSLPANLLNSCLMSLKLVTALTIATLRHMSPRYIKGDIVVTIDLSRVKAMPKHIPPKIAYRLCLLIFSFLFMLRKAIADKINIIPITINIVYLSCKNNVPRRLLITTEIVPRTIEILGLFPL